LLVDVTAQNAVRELRSIRKDGVANCSFPAKRGVERCGSVHRAGRRLPLKPERQDSEVARPTTSVHVRAGENRQDRASNDDGKRSSRRSVSYLSCPRQALHPEVDHLPSETGAVSALTAREEYEAGSESRTEHDVRVMAWHSGPVTVLPKICAAPAISDVGHSWGVIESIICALLPVLSTRRMNRSEVSTACASLTPAACTNRLQPARR